MFDPSVCVAGALSECVDPMIAVTVNGVVCDVESNTDWRPDGFEAIVRFTVWGCRETLVVVLTPSESVAVRNSSR